MFIPYQAFDLVLCRKAVGIVPGFVFVNARGEVIRDADINCSVFVGAHHVNIGIAHEVS